MRVIPYLRIIQKNRMKITGFIGWIFFVLILILYLLSLILIDNDEVEIIIINPTVLSNPIVQPLPVKHGQFDDKVDDWFNPDDLGEVFDPNDDLIIKNLAINL